MKTFALYGPDGRIYSIYTGLDESDAQLSGVTFLECDPTTNDIDHYVDISEHEAMIKDKLPLGCTASTENFTVVLKALPPLCRVVVEGQVITSDGDDTEIEFDAPGTYEIHIYPPPQYRDEILEVAVG